VKDVAGKHQKTTNVSVMCILNVLVAGAALLSASANEFTLIPNTLI
jgi:hypothetical protein